MKIGSLVECIDNTTSQSEKFKGMGATYPKTKVAYPVGEIKLGSIRILFRSTYIRFIQQCFNGQYTWCEPR